MGWLNGWNYAQQVNITGSSSASTNYQVPLLVGESSGSTGVQFNVNGHSANFPVDLRFTSSNGTTLLNYYVEKITGTAPNRVAKIWVQVANSLATNQIIFCYYGNSTATNISSGTNTFTLFDDFTTYATGSNISGQNGWNNLINNGSGSYATVNSVDGKNMLQLYSGSQALVVSKACNLPNSVSVYAYVKNIAAAESFNVMMFNNQSTAGGSPQYGYMYIHWGWGNTLAKIDMASNFANTYIASTNLVATANTYYTVEDRFFSNTLSQYVNNSLIQSVTDSTYTNETYLGLQVYSTSNIAVSYIFVRQYVSPEPVFSSAGAELTPPVGGTSSGTSNFFLFF